MKQQPTNLMATVELNDAGRFITKSAARVHWDLHADGETITLFATMYGTSEGLADDHAIHSFGRDTPLIEVLQTLAGSNSAVCRQMAEMVDHTTAG